MARYSKGRGKVSVDEVDEAVDCRMKVVEDEFSDGQLRFGEEIQTVEESQPGILNEDGTIETIDNALDLIKPGKFDIRNFHEEFNDNSEKVLLQLLAMQSNEQPLKKGGIGIAYRCDAIILANRQTFSIQENTLFDIISAYISSNPDDKAYMIYARDAGQYLSYSDDSYVYKILKEATETLSNKPLLFDITMDNGKKRRIKVPWYKILTYYGKDIRDDDENAYISFTPTDFFKTLMISSTVTHGAHYSIKASTKIQSKYVRNLYYFLETRKNYRAYPNAIPGIFRVSLEELRTLVGYPESYRPTDVRRYILNPAVKEINSIEELDFRFDYELIKSSNGAQKKRITDVELRVTKIFSIEEKKIEEDSTDEKAFGIEEADQLVLQILSGQGLSEREGKAVFKKYKENQRDIVFLTQAIASVAATTNVKSKVALLCHIMDEGLQTRAANGKEEAHSEKANKFKNFNQREYDYEELEKTLLTTDVPK